MLPVWASILNMLITRLPCFFWAGSICITKPMDIKPSLVKRWAKDPSYIWTIILVSAVQIQTTSRHQSFPYICLVHIPLRDKDCVSILPGAAGEFTSLCWLLFCVCSNPLLLQWNVKDPSHFDKSAGGRLHLNTNTPLTKLGVSWYIVQA